MARGQLTRPYETPTHLPQALHNRKHYLLGGQCIALLHIGRS